MPNTPTRDQLTISVDRTLAEQALQINLSLTDAAGNGEGYRIAGPKHYNMGTTELLSYEIDARDAAEVRRMLDAAYPPAPVLSAPERAYLRTALSLFTESLSDGAVDEPEGYTAGELAAALASLRTLAGGES